MESSNIRSVVSGIADFLTSFNFTMPGKDQSLGRDCAGHEAQRIIGRCERKVGPDGTPWDENTDSTIKGKKSLGWGQSTPNRATNKMLSQRAIEGETRIEPDLIVMVYGTDEKAKESYSPSGKLRKSDEALTDRQKAYLAHTGQSKKHVKRPFFGVGTGDAESLIDEVLQPRMDEAVREWNAK